MRLLPTYFHLWIILSAAAWPDDHLLEKNVLVHSGIISLTYHEQDTAGLQASDLRLSIRQDTDTIVLEAIKINRPLIFTDSLQVHDYFQRLSQQTSPGWKSIFIDRSTSKRPMLPNRSSSTSSLISIDLLSLIGKLTKKRSTDEVYILWGSKEHFIEQHFDAALVNKMTGLSDAALQDFVRDKRPSASDISDTVIYELMKYIKSKHDEE